MATRIEDLDYEDLKDLDYEDLEALAPLKHKDNEEIQWPSVKFKFSEKNKNNLRRTSRKITKRVLPEEHTRRKESIKKNRTHPHPNY